MPLFLPPANGIPLRPSMAARSPSSALATAAARFSASFSAPSPVSPRLRPKGLVRVLCVAGAGAAAASPLLEALPASNICAHTKIRDNWTMSDADASATCAPQCKHRRNRPQHSLSMWKMPTDENLDSKHPLIFQRHKSSSWAGMHKRTRANQPCSAAAAGPAAGVPCCCLLLDAEESVFPCLACSPFKSRPEGKGVAAEGTSAPALCLMVLTASCIRDASCDPIPSTLLCAPPEGARAAAAAAAVASAAAAAARRFAPLCCSCSCAAAVLGGGGNRRSREDVDALRAFAAHGTKASFTWIYCQ